MRKNLKVEESKKVKSKDCNGFKWLDLILKDINAGSVTCMLAPNTEVLKYLHYKSKICLNNEWEN